MKTLLFGKDDAASDAKRAREWFDEQGIEWNQEIRVENEYGEASKIFRAKDGRFLVIETSCGVYEDVYEIDTFEVESIVFKALNDLCR
jgi:hypothetical protein